MSKLNHDHSPRTARLPGWVTGLVVLQSLTLLVAITGRPATPEAAAAQYRAAQSDEGRGNTLPNAADQRLQQIRLLGQIKEELTRANQKLEQIHTAVKDDDEQAPPQQ